MCTCYLNRLWFAEPVLRTHFPSTPNVPFPFWVARKKKKDGCWRRPSSGMTRYRHEDMFAINLPFQPYPEIISICFSKSWAFSDVMTINKEPNSTSGTLQLGWKTHHTHWHLNTWNLMNVKKAVGKEPTSIEWSTHTFHFKVFKITSWSGL